MTPKPVLWAVTLSCLLARPSSPAFYDALAVPGAGLGALHMLHQACGHPAWAVCTRSSPGFAWALLCAGLSGAAQGPVRGRGERSGPAFHS